MKSGNNKKVTLRDIAEHTGFTINTVSHALHGKSDISEKTKAIIQQAARELGYVRNTMASSLRSGRSHTLALIVGMISNPKFAVMVDDIETAARAYKYSLIILCTHDDPALEKKAIQTALERQVDGIIINPTQLDTDCVTQLQSSGVPFVFIERHFEQFALDYVICDEEEGGYLAAKHLLQRGHGKIAHFSGPEHVSSAIGRRDGFLRATEDLPSGNACVLPAKGPKENIAEIRRLYAEGFRGFFFFSDMLVWELMATLQVADPAFLENLAFVGFDNIQGSYPFPSPICSIDPSSGALCKETVDLLHRRILGEAFPPMKRVLPVRLVCRQSCR